MHGYKGVVLNLSLELQLTLKYSYRDSVVQEDWVHSLRRVRTTGDQHRMPASSIDSCLLRDTVKFPGIKSSTWYLVLITPFLDSSPVFGVWLKKMGRSLEMSLHTDTLHWITVWLQNNGASRFWSVWDSEQGNMAVSGWDCGSGCEDTAV